MNKQIISGKLLGVADGPVILIEVRGQEKSFPLACGVRLEWIFSHMNKPVTVQVTDGKVTEVA